MCLLGVLGSQRMRCVCELKPPSRTRKVEALPWKQAASRIWLAEIISCWDSFWPCGGSVIWRLPACIMENATGLIDLIAARKAFSGWGDYGCYISSIEHRALGPFVAVYLLPRGKTDGPSLYAFQKCQGERSAT